MHKRRLKRGPKEKDSVGQKTSSAESKAEWTDGDHWMVTGWGLDPPSEIHDAQPLSGRDINLRDVLKSSQKHTDPHHCQQLKPKTLLMFRV